MKNKLLIIGLIVMIVLIAGCKEKDNTYKESPMLLSVIEIQNDENEPILINVTKIDVTNVNSIQNYEFEYVVYDLPNKVICDEEYKLFKGDKIELPYNNSYWADEIVRKDYFVGEDVFKLIKSRTSNPVMCERLPEFSMRHNPRIRLYYNIMACLKPHKFNITKENALSYGITLPFFESESASLICCVDGYCYTRPVHLGYDVIARCRC